MRGVSPAGALGGPARRGWSRVPPPGLCDGAGPEPTGHPGSNEAALLARTSTCRWRGTQRPDWQNACLRGPPRLQVLRDLSTRRSHARQASRTPAARAPRGRACGPPSRLRLGRSRGWCPSSASRGMWLPELQALGSTRPPTSRTRSQEPARTRLPPSPCALPPRRVSCPPTQL